MGSHKKKGFTSPEVVPAPITADYHVSGTLNPDATCNYDIAGEYNEKNYLRRKDGSWFVWFHNVYDVWFITQILGEESPISWSKETVGMEGDYIPGPGVTGTATLSSGAH